MAIPTKIYRVLLAVLLLVVGITLHAPASWAAPLQDFNKSLDAAMRHHRGAGFYLRTGNIALAQLELDAFAAKSKALAGNYALSPPNPDLPPEAQTKCLSV